MKILFIPKNNEDKEITYVFTDMTIKATYGNVTGIFDFTNLPDGEMQIYDPENGDSVIETTLSYLPIVSAKKINGEMHVELINFVKSDASNNELFPKWIEHTEYKEKEDRQGTIHEVVNFVWKTAEDIENEKKKREEELKRIEQTPTPEERIEMLEQAILFLSME